MQMTSGTRVGHYEVESLLGSGGMGEVYRARDTRLGRSVALKILAPGFTARPDTVRRFELEARAASSLNHPHILHIYDVGEQDGMRYIAMELIEGETLRRKIGRLSFAELLDPLIQVAEALAKAHEAGIVHRDLKPENIIITPDGYAKVLDFGLAKLIEDQLWTPDAATAELQTRSGVVLGTVGYMSPEQVEGRAVDGRSDVFSFGCVLAEVATGSRPFRGTSMVDTLHQIVHDDPPPMTGVPPDVANVIVKSLAKKPEERYASMRDLAAQLRVIRRTIESESSGATVMLHRPKRRRAGIFAAGAAAAIAAVAVIMLRQEPPSTPPATPAARQPFSKMDIEQVTFFGDVRGAAIAPTGRYLAYTRGDRLLLRQMSTGADLELVRGASGIAHPRFSPDEQYVYYHLPLTERDHHDVYRVPSLGGQPKRVLSGIRSAITFAPNGRELAFVEPRPNGASDVWAADYNGVKTRLLYSGPRSVSGPAWSPRGDQIACLSFQDEVQPVSLSVIDVSRQSLAAVRSPFHGYFTWYLDGKALIVPQMFPEPFQQLRYVPFPTGEAKRITSDLHNYLYPTITRDGRLVAVVQLQRSGRIWLAPEGRPGGRELTPMVAGKNDGFDMTWVDAETLMFRSSDRTVNIKTIRIDGTNEKTLVSEPYNSRFLISSPLAISPDRTRVAYASHAEDAIYVTDLDGGSRKKIVDGTALEPNWTADGRWIVYMAYERFGAHFNNKGLWRVSPDGGSPILIDAEGRGFPMILADGRLIQRLGRRGEMRLREYSIDGETKRDLPVVIKGGHRCGWSADRREIDCVGEDGDLWRHSLSGGKPRKVADLDEPIDQWAWSPDGKYLAVARGADRSDVVYIHDRSE